jgi:malonate-semialdehyde dehydrogenase (acetylating)/methylmalonate-semialdehyde dehydrogenase
VGQASLTKRTQVLFAFRSCSTSARSEIAALITAEHGKVLSDALGEVTRGLEVAEFACGIPHLLKGGFSENVSTKVDVYSIRQPLGVVAVISPFNFPAMVPMWFVPIAIACGNAVVIKPSEKDPSAVNAVAELWKEAGLPDGVLNVVHGDKEAVDALLTHPDVKAVSFVGSTPIAKYVYETGTAHGKRVQALGGAKNHMLVLPDADLDLAADAAVNAGFGSAGERCMAISALLAVEPIADDLDRKITDRMGKLVTGDGTRGCDMGPLVTAQHRDKVVLPRRRESRPARPWSSTAATVTSTPMVTASSSGRPVRQRHPGHVDLHRRDLRPGALGGARRLLRRGPEAHQRQPYGNGTAIFTNDGGAARRFQNEVEVGMVGINVPIPVPMAYYSFGGWKNSLCSATATRTAWRASTSSPAARSSPRAGSTRATAASTSASRRTGRRAAPGLGTHPDRRRPAGPLPVPLRLPGPRGPGRVQQHETGRLPRRLRDQCAGHLGAAPGLAARERYGRRAGRSPEPLTRCG